jgi:hypothetical protein
MDSEPSLDPMESGPCRHTASIPDFFYSVAWSWAPTGEGTVSRSICFWKLYKAGLGDRRQRRFDRCFEDHYQPQEKICWAELEKCVSHFSLSCCCSRGAGAGGSLLHFREGTTWVKNVRAPVTPKGSWPIRAATKTSVNDEANTHARPNLEAG